MKKTVVFHFLQYFLINLSFTHCLEVTNLPPVINVPVYSLATKDNNGKTGMNILTYATPVSIKPDRIWSLGLFKGTVAHENFSETRGGVLQLLTGRHSKVVKLLGGSSGRDVDKKQKCEKLGMKWVSIDKDIPDLLPECAYYLKVSLVGDLIDCGSHELAICKIESMLVPSEADNISQEEHLSSAELRDLGIITKQGRVAD